MAVAPEQLDREKICPFLIKIFIVEKQPHQIKKYRFKDYPEDCIEYQTWFDCTLFELTKEIMDLRRNLFKRACQLEFRIIKFDSELKSFDGLNIGTTNSTHTEEIDDGKVKLSSTRFEIGNWIEVCIKPLEEKKVEHFSSPLKRDSKFVISRVREPERGRHRSRERSKEGESFRQNSSHRGNRRDSNRFERRKSPDDYRRSRY